MPSEHWWNADFDLAIQPGWDSSTDLNLEAQVRELALHALPAAAPEDSVLVFDPPPEDFLRYLNNRGIAVPRFSVFPEIQPNFRFKPYGWSPQAMALNSRYDQPTPSPPIDTVRRVNGRSFGHRLEREVLGSQVPRGRFHSLAEVQAMLASEPERKEGWVAKTEHGNAALGNLRLRHRHLSEKDEQWLTPRLERGPMVLEWWLPRTRDLCAVLDITAEGGVEDLTIHETIHTSDGGFIGALYDRDLSLPDPWNSEMIETAKIVAAALTREGYFGPVCIDSLVWNDDGQPTLRPLVEINARHYASEGWRRLANLWGGCLCGRFFSARKLRLPQTYEDFENALATDAWNRRSNRGTLLTSPMWLEGQGNRRRSRKLGVVFCEDSKKEVVEMESRFRKVFER